MKAPVRKRFDDMDPAQQAGILCNDPRFQEFAARYCDVTTERFNANATTEFLRVECGVKSRATLNTNPEAASRFAALRTEFDAWTGKIATPR